MAIIRPHPMPKFLDRIRQTLIVIASTFYRKSAIGVKYVQFGQMLSVLNRLSDEQLAQIGVRRSDLPAYARRLIYGLD